MSYTVENYKPIDVDDVPSMMTALTGRHRQRDERMDIIQLAVNGDFDLVDDQGDTVANRSPNLIQVALEDTAESAAKVPSVRVKPSSLRKKRHAAAMEQIGTGYLEQSQIDLLTIKSFMDLAAFGFFSWVVEMDEESGTPVIRWRNPRMCYQEQGWHTMDSTRLALFMRDVPVTALPYEWQEKIYTSKTAEDEPPHHPSYWSDKSVTLVEIFNEHEKLTCAVFKSGKPALSTSKSTYIPIELCREDNQVGICPVIVAERLTLDGEPRGQFDQIVNVMRGHIQLMSTLMDYADQAVYSDVWVKDLIGQMPVGGGSYIQLGPQGGIGRVQPAVSSLQVFEELDRMMDGIHVGGRWPKVRPGEVDQSIASAKFMEASAGMMNTAIRTMHFIMKRAIEQALRVCFAMDKKMGKDEVGISGTLRNQQFQIDRNKDDIDLQAQVRAEYGMGLGRDPAQAMVLAIQAAQAELVSKEFCQENIEGVQDVDLEKRRIDEQKFRDMALGKLMEGMQNGEVPIEALTKIAKARRNGEDIFDLFDKYIVEPQKEIQENQLTSGLDGSTMMPGAPPPGPGTGVAPPPAPPPEQLLGGGPVGPPQSINRTSVPMGPGSFAGVETQMGGPK